MPHISSRYGSSGPIIDVWIGLSGPRMALERAHGRQPTSAIKLPFLIDTGADTTMVNEDTMRSLAIPPRGSREIVGATTHIAPTTCDTFDISFEIRTSGDPPLSIPALEVLARPFFNVSIYGLIGRDILDRLVLTIGRGQLRLDY